MRTLFAAATLLATTLLTPVAQANLINNGSFEATAVGNGSWTIVGSTAGWSVGAAGLEIRNNAVGAAHSGFNFVELDTTGNSSIVQTLNIAAAGLYHLSWAYSPRAGVAAASNGINVLWDGILLSALSGNGAGQNGNVWQVFNHAFNVAAGVHTLSFVAVGSSDSLGGSLDSVSLLRDVQGTDVPEPASLAVMGLGLLGLLSLRRRKH